MSADPRVRAALAAARARLARPRLWWVVATLALGIAGWSFAGVIYGAADPEARALRLAGGLAAATVAAPAWYLLVTRRGRHTLPRGAVAGLLAGVLSYPAFWAYALPLTEVAKGRPGGAVLGLGIGLAFGVTFGLFGLLFAPFSGAVGGVTGAAVALLARAFVGRDGDGDPGRGGDDAQDGPPGDARAEPADPADPAEPSTRGRTVGPTTRPGDRCRGSTTAAKSRRERADGPRGTATGAGGVPSGDRGLRPSAAGDGDDRRHPPLLCPRRPESGHGVQELIIETKLVIRLPLSENY